MARATPTPPEDQDRRDDGDRPETYVIGHRNPDTDSIGSAIAYAELQCRLDPAVRYVPCRLGDVNPQTAWALERAEAPEPAFLPHVMLRVGDVMRRRFPSVSHEESVRDAGQLMVHEGLELLPVVDDDGALTGVLTEQALAQRYVRESREASRLPAPTTVSEMVQGLDGELLCGDAEARTSGRVWVLAMDTPTMLADAEQGDVAVIGDRPDAQVRAVESGIAVLVLSNGVEPGDGLLETARAQGASVVRTRLDSYVAGRMITLSAPCVALVDREPLTARADDLVGDVSDDIKDVSYRAALVLDRARRPVGLVTRQELVAPRPRRVILVDHAEQAQSVAGIEHAEIVEILDHHHIGSIETRLPVRATFDPVGSTATLVTERFRFNDLEPTAPSATMLMAAVLSDTVMLNSPTTTDRDRVALEWLGEFLGLDPLSFGRQMFRAGSDLTGVPAEEVLGRDAKSYELSSGDTLCIAQIETVGEGLDSRMEELLDAARRRREDEGHRLVALMVTDVLEHGTELLVAGDVGFAERALGAQATDGVISLPGVMSRKKQVAPKLLAAG